MKTSFMSHHGYYSGWSSEGSVLLLILLVTTVILLIILISKVTKSIRIPEYDELLNILKERYAKGEITADDYRERSIILEDEYNQDDYWEYAENTEMVLIKGKYAKGEIDSREYIEKSEAIKKEYNSSPLEILKERFSNGEISEKEFKKIKNEIR